MTRSRKSLACFSLGRLEQPPAWGHCCWPAASHPQSSLASSECAPHPQPLWAQNVVPELRPPFSAFPSFLAILTTNPAMTFLSTTQTSSRSQPLPCGKQILGRVKWREEKILWSKGQWLERNNTADFKLNVSDWTQMRISPKPPHDKNKEKRSRQKSRWVMPKW